MKKLRPQLYALIEALDTCAEGDNDTAGRVLESFIDTAGNALGLSLCGCHRHDETPSKARERRREKRRIMRPNTSLAKIQKDAIKYMTIRAELGDLITAYENLGTIRAVAKTGVKNSHWVKDFGITRYTRDSEKCKETQEKIIKRVIDGEYPSNIARDSNSILVFDVCYILCKNEIVRELKRITKRVKP